MRIPNYYCPNCRKFKKWYQVDNIETGTYCKHCDTEIVYSEDLLEDYVSNYIKKEKEVKALEEVMNSDIAEFSKWCYVNGIDFSCMGKKSRNTFLNEVLFKYAKEKAKGKESEE